MSIQKVHPSDAEKNQSSRMNAVSAESSEVHVGGVRVVFLGNSITLHPPLPAIGWTGEWGMAASAPENDYVHLVVRGIEQATGRAADVRVRNLADFERGFENYDFAREQDLINFDPEYLIVALGENVAELPAREERLAFRDAFKRLLEGFLHGNYKPSTVVRGVFWHNDWKDEMMAHAASDLALPFVKADLDADERMTAIGLFQHEGVQRHPGDLGHAEIARRILEGFFPTDAGYEVWADAKPVLVRPIRVSAMPFNQFPPGYQRPADQTEVAGMVNIESDGPVEFRVRPGRQFTAAKIRPLRIGVTPAMADGEIRFTLPGPGCYVLELDGYHRPLEIFVNPRRDFAADYGEATVVFGPGIHNPVTVKLKSHDRVYLDRDAFVLGSFQADGVEDVKVFGHGIICGSRNRRSGVNECIPGTIFIIDSRDVVFDGPVVLDSPGWCVASLNSRNLEFANLKVTGAWRYNTDGIDVCNSQHVHIHDCFVHSFDDAIVLKGLPVPSRRDDPVEDVRVERCVCWCGWGRTLEIGFETWAARYRGIVFEDCDLIHNNHAALSVHLGGPAIVEDITFRRIRIEYDASEMESVFQHGRDAKGECPAPWSGNWLDVGNCRMELDYVQGGMSYFRDADVAGEPYGTFEHLTVEDIGIAVESGAVQPGFAIYAVPGSSLGAISVSNVRVNGLPLPPLALDTMK